MNSIPPEVASIITFLLCGITILLMLKYFGAAGLYVYIVLAVIIGNVQSLKAAQFAFMNQPVALGTVVFASTFLATDILTERYGKKRAQRAVWLGFVSSLIIVAFMLLTLAVKPLGTHPGSPYHRFDDAHNAIATLFLPAPAIFAASLISYFASQQIDIILFQIIKRMTNGRLLWLRSNVSTLVSSLLDNIIFSTLAWYIFAPNPLDISTLVFTYILGTYWLRVIASIANTPFMYLSKLSFWSLIVPAPSVIPAQAGNQAACRDPGSPPARG